VYDELVGYGRKQSCLVLRYYPSVCYEGLRKITEVLRIGGILAETQSQDLRNTNRIADHLAKLLDGYLIRSRCVCSSNATRNKTPQVIML